MEDQALATTPTMASPLSMPPNALQRSPSNSSLNTRQRSEFEASQAGPVLFDEDDLMDCDAAAAAAPDELAHEMPFATEPALEGELEQQLPPLKKLKPNGMGEEGSTVGELGVKSCLAKRTDGAPTVRPFGRSGSFLGEDLNASILLDRRGPTSLTPLSLETLGRGRPPLSASTPSSSFSRPMSRRSSSGASSSCGSNALKAVRFASGNGFSSASPSSTPTAFWTSDDEHSPSSSHEVSEPVELPTEVPGPVAAVVYLTHSREAYDRSPIVVDGDGNLSLPPRETKAGERGWIKCGKKRCTTPKPPLNALASAAGLEHEARMVRRQKERLRQEIEALGRAGLGDSLSTPYLQRRKGSLESHGSGVSPLLRTIGLGESRDRAESAGTTTTSAWAHEVAISCASAAASVSEPAPFMPPPPPPVVVSSSEHEDDEDGDDPNTMAPPSPDDVYLDEVASELGDENPGDALSDDGSVGSIDESGYAREHEEGEHHDDDDDEDDEEGAEGVEDDRAEDDEKPDDDVQGNGGEEEEEEEEDVDPEEEEDRKRRRQMGMCGLGKWTRDEVYSCDDALGGF